MKFLIIGILGFLIVVYLFTYRRYKRKKGKTIDTVQDFHRKYAKQNQTVNGMNSSSEKMVDFLDKESLIADVQKELQNTKDNNQIPVKKKFIL